MHSKRRLRVASRTWRGRISSHDSFTHDSIDSLGYDWGRIADPAVAPRFPFKVYIPQSTQDVIRAVREVRQLGERLVIRSKGHSSNDLALNEGGAVLVTEKLNRILEIDTSAMTATVQSGAISALIDDELAERGFGLPIIGDHAHIAVGGFASSGGFSPASHRHGMFIDNVASLEYVDWDGELHHCSATEQPERFHAVLAGLGQQGVIVTLTLRILQVDKYRTVLRNRMSHHLSLERFIEDTRKHLADPGEALLQRGIWVDLRRIAGRTIGIGQFSAYHATTQSRAAQLRQTASYGYLHGLGYVAGRLPRRVDEVVKMVGMTGVLFSPRYASIKNVEIFTDKLLDSSVGDPTRMMAVIAPLATYAEVCRELMDALDDARTRYGCFSFLPLYVKMITSPYLGRGGDPRYCEVMLYPGIVPGRMTPQILDEVISRIDDITIRHHGYRYMHTKTSKDPERRRLIDPNAPYAAALREHLGAGAVVAANGHPVELVTGEAR